MAEFVFEDPFDDTLEEIRQSLFEQVEDLWPDPNNRPDLREASLLWTLLSPIAFEIQRFQQDLNVALELGFLQFTFGEFLDLRGLELGLPRKEGNEATGILRFFGTEGAAVPLGTTASTTAVDDGESYAYDTTDAGTLAGIPDPVSVNEIQKLNVTGFADFTLTLNDATTGPLPYNASAAQITAALEAGTFSPTPYGSLSGGPPVKVIGNALSGATIEFSWPSTQYKDIELLEVTPLPLDEVQTLQITGLGSFKLFFDGIETTTVFTETSTIASVISAINTELGPFSPSYPGFNVTTTYAPDSDPVTNLFDIVFSGPSVTFTDVPNIQVTSIPLGDTIAPLATTTTVTGANLEGDLESGEFVEETQKGRNAAPTVIATDLNEVQSLDFKPAELVATTLQNGQPGLRNRVELLTVPSVPTTGSFKLVLSVDQGVSYPYTTIPIAFNASAATLKSTIEGTVNSGFAPGDISITEFSGGPNINGAPVTKFKIEYVNNLRYTDDFRLKLSPIAGDNTLVDAGSNPVIPLITEFQDATQGLNERQNLKFETNTTYASDGSISGSAYAPASGGTFRLVLNNGSNSSTVPVVGSFDYDVSAGVLQSVLNSRAAGDNPIFGNQGINAVQKITAVGPLASLPTSGFYRIKFNNNVTTQYTANISYDATAADVQAALELLTPGSPVDITVSTAGVNEIQRITIGTSLTAGAYKLTVPRGDGGTVATSNIAYDAPLTGVGSIEEAINLALLGYGASVSVIGTAAAGLSDAAATYVEVVYSGGNVAKKDLAQLIINDGGPAPDPYPASGNVTITTEFAGVSQSSGTLADLGNEFIFTFGGAFATQPMPLIELVDGTSTNGLTPAWAGTTHAESHVTTGVASAFGEGDSFIVTGSSLLDSGGLTIEYTGKNRATNFKPLVVNPSFVGTPASGSLTLLTQTGSNVVDPGPAVPLTPITLSASAPLTQDIETVMNSSIALGSDAVVVRVGAGFQTLQKTLGGTVDFTITVDHGAGTPQTTALLNTGSATAAVIESAINALVMTSTEGPYSPNARVTGSGFVDGGGIFTIHFDSATVQPTAGGKIRSYRSLVVTSTATFDIGPKLTDDGALYEVEYTGDNAPGVASAFSVAKKDVPEVVVTDGTTAPTAPTLGGSTVTPSTLTPGVLDTTDEVQEISVGATELTGGQYKLTIDNGNNGTVTTADIPFDAVASVIEVAITEALGFQGVTVTESGSGGLSDDSNVVTLTYDGGLGWNNVAGRAITLSGSVSGSDFQPRFIQTQVGSGALNAKYLMTLSHPNGYAQLKWGETSPVITTPISVGLDTAETVKHKLEELGDIGAGNLTVTGGPFGTAPIEIEFSGATLDAFDRDMIESYLDNLLGGTRVGMIEKVPGHDQIGVVSGPVTYKYTYVTKLGVKEGEDDPDYEEGYGETAPSPAGPTVPVVLANNAAQIQINPIILGDGLTAIRAIRVYRSLNGGTYALVATIPETALRSTILGADPSSLYMAIVDNVDLITFNGTTDFAPSSNTTPVLDLEAEAQEILDEDGFSQGSLGNVDARTIENLEDIVSGVPKVINPEPFGGGSDREDDETYRARLIEFAQKDPGAGNIDDYISWAKEVDGVINVSVLPEWQEIYGPLEGPGTVKVVVAGEDSTILPDEVIEETRLHIAGTIAIPDPDQDTPSATLAQNSPGGELEAGTYEYVYTYINVGKGETRPSAPSRVIVEAPDNSVLVSLTKGQGGIGPQNTIGRRIYRRKVDIEPQDEVDEGKFSMVAEILDNSTLSFLDDQSFDQIPKWFGKPASVYGGFNFDNSNGPYTRRKAPNSNSTSLFDGEAPVGAHVTVESITEETIWVSSEIYAASGWSVDGTGGRSNLTTALDILINNFFNEQPAGQDVKIVDIMNIIHDHPGVKDFRNTLLYSPLFPTGTEENIAIGDGVSATYSTAGTFSTWLNYPYDK